MNTFNKIMGCGWRHKKPKRRSLSNAVLGGKEPENLEEQAIFLLREKIFTTSSSRAIRRSNGDVRLELPAFIIRRLRFVIPTTITTLTIPYPRDSDWRLYEDDWSHAGPWEYRSRVECWFLREKDEYLSSGAKIVFTGMIDEFFDYELGTLEYRSLRFETEVVDVENYHGNAVVNYTDRETPYTRIIEHKHFWVWHTAKNGHYAWVSCRLKVGDEPYYPVNNKVNNDLYAQYKKLAQTVPQVIFGDALDSIVTTICIKLSLLH